MTYSTTFRWKEPSEWEPLVAAVIPTAIRSELTVLLRRHKKAFHYLDDVLAFQDVYSKIGLYVEVAAQLPTNLREAFGHVRMFHCCRPVDIKSYYECGIRVPYPLKLNEQFRALFFKNSSFPEITPARIDEAIEAAKDSDDWDDLVYFGLDDRYLIERCGHYLIYGSEYLQCLVAHIGRDAGNSEKAELRKLGIPTILVVDVPIECFSNHELCELGEAALHAWAYRLVHQKEEIRMLNFAISIEHGLPPGCIKEHYHPECVPDPFRSRIPYRYKATNDM